MVNQESREADGLGGLARWLMAKISPRPRAERRLALLERIALAPRQSLALVEAEGRRFLVATSADGGPSIYPLDEFSGSFERTARIGRGRPAGVDSRRPLKCASPRISW